MQEPNFTRGEVAKILGITPITIANREKANKYPAPNRDMNNYRVYTLSDVLNLQLITFNKIDGAPIISILYDKGFRDARKIMQAIDNAISNKKSRLISLPKNKKLQEEDI